MKMRRFTQTLVALGLSLGLIACGQTPATTSAPADSPSDATQTTAPADTGDATQTEDSGSEPAGDASLAPYDEPVTITWAVQTAAVQQFFDGDTYEDNRWSRLIKDKLNIDVEVKFSADSSTDAYRNRMSTLLASGDFPDVLRWSDRIFFQQAYEAGYIREIESVFDAYATDAVKAYRTNYPDSFEGASIDGTLAAFPYMNDNFHQAANLWIRDDWLENTKSEPPTTVEEMVELARKFTFEDPDGNGQDDTYGFALNKNVVQSNYATLLGLIGAYGVPGYSSTGIFYRDDSGEMTFAYIQPQLKDALALVHEMYKEGLIDPEFIVKDIATMEADIASGSIGMMYHMNWGTWHPFNISYQDSGVITRPYPIPTIEGIEPKMGIQSNMTGDLFMVSAACEHPEAIIKILNLYEQVAVSSDNPEDFKTYWADEQYRLSPIYIGIPTELFAPVLHEALAKQSPEGLAGTALEYYNYVVGFEDGSLANDSNAYGTWGQMHAAGTMRLDLDAQARGELVVNIMANEIPEIWKQNGSVLGTMVETAFTDIITGNKGIDSFDQFVEDWLEAGGRQTLEEMDKLYPAN